MFTIEFKLPDIGEGLEEGEIVKWLVKVGDTVKADQDIVQIETDKAVADLPAPVSGKINKINFKEGDTVKVGEVLCVIGSGAGKITSKNKMIDGGDNSQKNIKKSQNENIQNVPHSEPMKGMAMTEKVLAAPAVRKLARDMRIDLSRVKGTGENGRITKKDVQEFAPVSANGTKNSVPQQLISKSIGRDIYGETESVPLKGIRKTISQNMMRSIEGAAQLSAMEDINVSKLWKLREKEKRHFAIQGIKLTFLPFVIKAVIAALKENPILNSSIVDNNILIKKYYNIGIAVETEVGLMVPVLKNAEKKGISKIAREISELAEKSRNRRIKVEDMKFGTFTVTNYGSIGGNYATPILNPPEAAILGLGRIFDRVIMDKKGKLKNIKVLPISLTFDHRILDGAEAARFIESLKMFLEDPDHLFLQIEKNE